MTIQKIFDPKNESNWFWSIALLGLLIEFCFHALLPISISNDSYGYLDLSQHLGDPAVAFERSVGYSSFLSILGLNRFDSIIPVILSQAALSIAIPLIIFKSLVRFGLKSAVLGGFLSCCYFYNFIISLYILTEPLYVFSIAVFAFCLVKYFQKISFWNLIWVIASCWFINLLRLSGAQYFLSFLFGVVVYILVNLINRDSEKLKLGLKHFFLAVAVFGTISIIQGTLTNRTSSVIWPHFVFNWVYRDGTDFHYGIIKPENGPAAKKLFSQIEKMITESPRDFYTLKMGGSNEVQLLQPESDGKYSHQSVKMLMNDLIYNSYHPLRSWWIETALMQTPSIGIVKTSKLMGDAILEGFKKHPDVIFTRMSMLLHNYRLFITDGIKANNVTLSTAYPQQIPPIISTLPIGSLRPGFYKQWAYDLYNHTGNQVANRDFDYVYKFPISWSEAVENINSDNLIGFGHYVGILGMQALRLCWILMMAGICIFPFARNKPLLASLLCASIGPPIISMLVSELDPRHLLMAAPIQILTSVFVLYTMVVCYKEIKINLRGVNEYA